MLDGYDLFAIGSGFLFDYRRTDYRLRKAQGAIMSWIYLLSGGLVLAVFVYLIVALFFPEKF